MDSPILCEKLHGISVAEFMRGCPADLTLLGGSDGLHREITRANIYADDTILDWVTSGEFLIMTELNCKGWSRERWSCFLERASALELSAIALKYSVDDPEIPEFLPALADGNRLPILRIPSQISVSDMTSEVFRQLFALQREILQRHQELNQALQQCHLEQRGIPGMMDLMEEHMQIPILFLADDYRAPEVRQAGNEELREAIIRDAEAARREMADTRRLQILEVEILGRKAWRQTVPVLVRNKRFGLLFSWNFSDRQDRLTLAIMQAVASNIALNVMQEYSVREVEIKHSSEFIEELLSNRGARGALDRAAVYKLDANDSYCMALIHFSAEGGQADSFNVYNYICENLNWIQAALERSKIHGFMAQRNSYLEMIIARAGEDDDELMKERIQTFVRELLRVIRGRLLSPGIQVRAGIGRFHDKLGNLSRSFAEAEKTVQIGAQLFREDCLFFADLGIFRILFQGEVHEEIESFFHETLDPLLLYDKKKGTELVRTLESYFQNNGNINKTSEDLFTHYNTILYRLERIREITGKELTNANDRLNLELALKVRRIFGSS